MNSHQELFGGNIPQDVTATDKVRVLVTYHRKMIGILIYCRIFGTVHKTDDCLSIHIPESMKSFSQEEGQRLTLLLMESQDL